MAVRTNKRKILENKAAMLRQRFGYNNSEPIHLKSLLLRLGVVALFREIDDEFSGMAMKVDLAGKVYRFMLINRQKTIGHQNFTICHELYHLFVQEKFASQICKAGKFDKKDVEEYNADLFASYFLLPEEGLYSIISDDELIAGQVLLSTIIRIENVFNCSRHALLIRLLELDLVNEEILEKYKKKVTQSASKYGYSPYLYMGSPDNSAIGNYGELARKLYEQERISESKYYTLMEELGLSITDVELLIEDQID